MPESSSEPMHALMPSRHEDTEGGWTTSTVLSLARSLVSEQEKRFVLALSALDERISLRFDLAEQARQIALTAQETAMRTALAAQEKLVSAALESAVKAVTKAETASEKRFEGVNEFRAALSDQQRNLMSRTEASALLQGMQDKLADITTRIDRGEGRGSGLQAGWGYLVTAIGLLLTILTIGGIAFALAR